MTFNGNLDLGARLAWKGLSDQKLRILNGASM